MLKVCSDRDDIVPLMYGSKRENILIEKVLPTFAVLSLFKMKSGCLTWRHMTLHYWLDEIHHGCHIGVVVHLSAILASAYQAYSIPSSQHALTHVTVLTYQSTATVTLKQGRYNIGNYLIKKLPNNYPRANLMWSLVKTPIIVKNCSVWSALIENNICKSTCSYNVYLDSKKGKPTH